MVTFAREGVRERRKFARIKSDFPVQQRLMPQGNSQRIHNSISKDLSEGGIQLSSFYFYPVNTRIMLDVFLACDEEPVHATGKVVWIEQIPYQERYKIGVQFSDVNEDSRQYLHRLMKKDR